MLLQAAGSALGGALSIVDNIFARKEQRKQNQKDRDFQVDMWNKTNDYNSPLKQMERLKAGGLNPNLVYGNGATTTASNVSPTTSKPLPAPNTGQVMSGFFQQFVDLQMKQTQNDLMQTEMMAKYQSIAESKQRSSNLEVDNYNKNLDSGIKNMVFKDKSLQYDKDSKLFDVSIDGAEATVKRQQLENKEKEIKLLYANEREQLAVYEAWARLKTAKATQSASAVETMLKQEQLNLRKKGIEVNDEAWWRIFSDVMPDKTAISKFLKGK